LSRVGQSEVLLPAPVQDCSGRAQNQRTPTSGSAVGRTQQIRRSRIGNTSNVIVHLIDGTYELFRHFYGLRRFTKGQDRKFGAVVGVLNTVLQMIEEGAAYLGVATNCGAGTKRAPGSIRHSWPSSGRSKMRLPRWESLCGR
jgi:hypothetical protein